ncbi:MAG TPA: YbjN domain-containing protein [Rhodobacterales bacterium]|nr:YbjN domain-containing protein [Rhodobacterales bacterium]
MACRKITSANCSMFSSTFRLNSKTRLAGYRTDKTMRLKKLLTAGLLAVAFVGGAQAGPVRAADPASFTDFFFDEGYPAQLSTDAVGDPYIEFRYNDITMPLWFYDCSDHAACQSVQFYFAYQLDEPLSLEKLNEWNGEDRRFTRAYVIDDGTLRLEMDVFTGEDGLSARDFKSLLSLWLDRLTEFEDFIGW